MFADVINDPPFIGEPQFDTPDPQYLPSVRLQETPAEINQVHIAQESLDSRPVVWSVDQRWPDADKKMPEWLAALSAEPKSPARPADRQPVHSEVVKSLTGQTENNKVDAWLRHTALIRAHMNAERTERGIQAALARSQNEGRIATRWAKSAAPVHDSIAADVKQMAHADIMKDRVFGSPQTYYMPRETTAHIPVAIMNNTLNDRRPVSPLVMPAPEAKYAIETNGLGHTQDTVPHTAVSRSHLPAAHNSLRNMRQTAKYFVDHNAPTEAALPTVRAEIRRPRTG